MNKKAEIFDALLTEQGLQSFDRSDLNDIFSGVLYRTHLNVKNQYLPAVIILDASIYSVVRVVLGDKLVNAENKAAIDMHINAINRSQKVFKYYYTDDGTLFLDACVVATDESFDPKLIQVVFEVILEHLQQTYGDTMSIIWNVNTKEDSKEVTKELE